MSETSTFARRIRAARSRARRHDIRDDVVPGLALRVYPSGARTFTLASMVRGRRRYATIGDAQAMTVPEARREARRLIVGYTEPAVRHDGPRSPGYPMTAFAGEFLDRQAPRWKPKTLKPTPPSCVGTSCPPSAG
ncbi:MAG: Arm DNA-binding domain-containing protein [Rhodospirillales bacterium]|nr:Arm DNA-binding domain-containing protein [Rhodospirillales bacterium]